MSDQKRRPIDPLGRRLIGDFHPPWLYTSAAPSGRSRIRGFALRVPSHVCLREDMTSRGISHGLGQACELLSSAEAGTSAPILVPRLVRAGHEVISISRGSRAAYTDAPEWRQVRHVVADREQQDREATFGDTVAGLNPEAVVDLVCFTLESATALVERLRGEIGHLLHCGSIWRYGPSHALPISETTGTAPVGEYGIQKDRIARMLKNEAADRRTGHHVPAPGAHRRPRLAPDRPAGQPRPCGVGHAFSRTAAADPGSRRRTHAPRPRRRRRPAFERAIHPGTRRRARTSTSSPPPR